MSDEQQGPVEADEADAAEQREAALPTNDEAEAVPPRRDDVDPADAAEQHRAVPWDEEDYR